MGSFSDAVQLAAATGAPANIAAVRQYQSRGGVSLNVEQQLSSDIALFARAGLADGSVEPFEFTDIDRTVAAGMVVSGAAWGHQDHTLGIAGVVNAISREHEVFLNAGGLGILVGDGILPPAPSRSGKDRRDVL
jgi:high affinity Mn2+ porin